MNLSLWRRKMSDSQATPPKRYSKHLVVWMDILGFSEWIERSKQDESQVARIAGVLDRAMQTASKVNLRPSGGWRRPTIARLLSDTVVVTIENPDFLSLSNVESLVEEFNMGMIQNGCFLRGAVVVGDHYQTDNYLFGPAVLKAIDMEKQLAAWPRIIVHPDVLRWLAEDVVIDDWLRSQLELFDMPMDRDGLRHINYLGRSFVFHEATKWEYQYRSSAIPDTLDIDPLLVHKTAIIDGIARERASGRPLSMSTMVKYHSLAVYHNDVIDLLCRCLELPTRNDQAHSLCLHELLRAHFYPPQRFGPDAAADAFFDAKMDELAKDHDYLTKKTIDDLPGLFPELYPTLHSVSLE
jgi:hypothetical protein